MYDEKWFGATDDEMKAYLARCIIMTVVNKHTKKCLVKKCICSIRTHFLASALY